MKKILILNFEFPPIGGGASVVSANLAKEFARLGNDVIVITSRTFDLPPHSMVDGYEVRRIFTFRKRKDHTSILMMLMYFLISFFPICIYVFKHKPDIIHCHFAVPCGLFGLIFKKLFRVSYLLSIHGGDVPDYVPDTKLFFPILKPLFGSICKNAMAITVSNEGLKNLVIKSFPLVKITIIKHGVTLSDFILKLKYGTGEKVKFLYVGRFSPEKDVEMLIRAFSFVVKKIVNAKLIMVGDGILAKKVKKMATEICPENSVIFTDWLSSVEVNTKMTESDILILTSRKENLPMVILQAMASGLPIISTKVWGVTELIKDGKGGLLIEVNDEEMLIKKMIHLAQNSDLWKKMGQENLNIVCNYTWDKIAKQYLELFFKHEV